MEVQIKLSAEELEDIVLDFISPTEKLSHFKDGRKLSYVDNLRKAKAAQMKLTDRRVGDLAHFGFLQKKSPSLLKGWQKRFFFLKKKELRWYKKSISLDEDEDKI